MPRIITTFFSKARKTNAPILFVFTIIIFFNKIGFNPTIIYGTICPMKKILCTLLVISAVTTANADTNPFFNGYDNQVTVNFGWGVDDGFLIPAPVKWVPFIRLHAQYSQPTEFFRLPARKSINLIQTLGSGTSRGWHWDKYTIPIASLSQDVILAHGKNWYFYSGLAVGMQLQQNERIGSKLLFGFKLGTGFKLSECTNLELFAQHYSNGITAPENNSYAFFGAGLTYNF